MTVFTWRCQVSEPWRKNGTSFLSGGLFTHSSLNCSHSSRLTKQIQLMLFAFLHSQLLSPVANLLECCSQIPELVHNFEFLTIQTRITPELLLSFREENFALSRIYSQVPTLTRVTETSFTILPELVANVAENTWLWRQNNCYHLHHMPPGLNTLYPPLIPPEHTQLISFSSQVLLVHCNIEQSQWSASFSDTLSLFKNTSIPVLTLIQTLTRLWTYIRTFNRFPGM